MKSYRKNFLVILLSVLTIPLVCWGEEPSQSGDFWRSKSQKEREKIWRVEMKNSLYYVFGGWRDAYLEYKKLWEKEEDPEAAEQYFYCANRAAHTHNRHLVRFKQVLDKEGVKYEELPFIGPRGELIFVPEVALLNQLTDGMDGREDTPRDRAWAEVPPAKEYLAIYRRYAKGGKREKELAADALLEYRRHVSALNLWLSLVREENGDAYYYAPLPVMKVDSKY